MKATSLSMVELMLHHYRQRLEQATNILEKIFIVERIQHYSVIQEKVLYPNKEYYKLNQCLCY